MATRDIDLIGTTLGNYKLTGMLGRGGMATVYRAMDTALKRDVALKVLSSQLSDEHDFIKRFQREAQAAAQLNHPNIVNVFSIGEDQGYHFFAMEYIKGKALSEMKRDEGKLSPKRAVSIIKAVADALGDAHRAGLVHRDIKPSNIMISKEGRVKVTDFGIAYLLNAQTKLTRDGSIIGTPEYLSPEQCEGKIVDGRSDIYSLGVTLYEILTGKTPYEADTPVSMIMKIVRGEFRPIKDLSPDIPSALQTIVEKMMAIDLSKRYADADEVIAALEQFEMETTGMTSSDMKSPRTRFDEKVPGTVVISETQGTQGTKLESPSEGTRVESNAPGTMMESPAPGTRVEAGTPGTIVEDKLPPAMPYQEVDPSKNALPEKKKGKSQGLIAAAIVVLLLGGAIAVKLLVLDKRGTSTNSLPAASGGSMGLATTQNQTGNNSLPADIANNPSDSQGSLDVTLANGNQTPSDSNGNTGGNSTGSFGTAENPSSSNSPSTTSTPNTRNFSSSPSSESPVSSSPSRTNINRNIPTAAMGNRQPSTMDSFAPSLPPARTCAVTVNGSRDSDFIGSYAEEILGRRKIQVIDADGNIASSARHQLTISVANLGTEELSYYGRSSTQTTIRITLKVIDPRTRKVVAGPANKEVSYTNLNRQDNIKEALREMISKIQSALENN